MNFIVQVVIWTKWPECNTNQGISIIYKLITHCIMLRIIIIIYYYSVIILVNVQSIFLYSLNSLNYAL